MSHWPCDSMEDTGAASTLGWERLGHKPRSAHEEVAQPVPYTGGVPGDFYIRGSIRAPHAAVLSLRCAGLFAWRIYLRLLEFRGVSWSDTKRHQGQADNLGGAQEWPQESLTRTSTNSETS